MLLPIALHATRPCSPPAASVAAAMTESPLVTADVRSGLAAADDDSAPDTEEGTATMVVGGGCTAQRWSFSWSKSSPERYRYTGYTVYM